MKPIFLQLSELRKDEVYLLDVEELMFLIISIRVRTILLSTLFIVRIIYGKKAFKRQNS